MKQNCTGWLTMYIVILFHDYCENLSHKSRLQNSTLRIQVIEERASEQEVYHIFFNLKRIQL